MSNYTKFPDFNKSGQEEFNQESEVALSLLSLQKKALASEKTLFKSIKTFNEISNEIAMSTLFGKKSSFYKPTVEDYDTLSKDFYTAELNYELLAQDLKNKLDLMDGFLFDATKYSLKEVLVNSASMGSIPVMTSVKQKKPFFYTKDNEQRQAVFDSGKLNTRKNLLSTKYNYRISYDNYKVVYNLNFIYKDGEDKKEYDRTSSSDFRLKEEYYAIQLYTENVETFIEFIRLIKTDDYAERMKSNVIKNYHKFFEEVQDNPNILDALYEKIPDFVLETLTDEKLWNDFVLLSEKGINTVGTNENVSVINIIKGIKNAFWWCNKINENPEIIKTILSKLSNEYLEEFVILITNKIGIPTWKNTDYENAILYSLEQNDLDNGFSKYRIVYWCGFIKKEKKFEVGYSLHSYFDKMSISPSNTKSTTLGIVNAFTPLKITEKEDSFLPAIVANYFTEEQLSEDKWTVLNNILTGILPELSAGITRGTAILSRLSSGRKIKTVEELIEFLGKVDQNVMAEDLEKVGIQALFRGTTKNINGELFTGNLSSMSNGTSTSTDPIRAVIFGIESSSKPGAKGVLQVYAPKDLKGLNLQGANNRFKLELEVVVNTSPENLSNFAIKEIPIEDARKLVEEVYGISLDTRITSQDYSRYLLENTTKLTPKEALDFYKKAIKLK